MGQINKTLPWEILPGNSGRGDRIDYLIEGDFDGKPFSETTAVNLVVDHGSAEFDNFEIKPIHDQ